MTRSYLFVAGLLLACFLAFALNGGRWDRYCKENWPACTVDSPDPCPWYCP